MGEGEDPFIQYRENEIIESRVSEEEFYKIQAE